MINNIRAGDEEARPKDVLSGVYEYFLVQFASAEGKKGGEFYTPRYAVRLQSTGLESDRDRIQNWFMR